MTLKRILLWSIIFVTLLNFAIEFITDYYLYRTAVINCMNEGFIITPDKEFAITCQRIPIK